MFVFTPKKHFRKIMKYSEVESKRFGLRVFRDGILSVFSPDEIVKAFYENKAQIYIFRLPVEWQNLLFELQKLGLEMIVADTLVYYTADLNKIQVPALRNELDFEVCTPDHYPLLDSMVATIFKDYLNHYHANPYLDKQNILAGYQEWAREYVKPSGAEKTTFLIRKQGNWIGFATCGFGKEYSEGVLYGVMPEAQGGGIYGDIIRYTQKISQEKGFSKMKVSTQVHNYAVQKVWTRENFWLSQAYLTVHLCKI